MLPGQGLDSTAGGGKHNHGIAEGTRLALEGGGGVTWVPREDHAHILYNHGHTIDIPNHQHLVVVPDHQHSILIPDHQHSINIPNHKHSISIPDHDHELEFGIYQGSIADSVQIRIDGKTIPQTEPGQDIDIVAFLGTDGAGKIQRNTWHEIEIIPNKMTRVIANIFMQIFTNSRGGGDY